MSNQKHGEIVHLKDAKSPRVEPKVIGAKTASDPQVFDSRSKTEQHPVETTVHGEAVTVRQHVRSKPQKKNEPDVRLRMMSREEREIWNRIRRAEEE